MKTLSEKLPMFIDDGLAIMVYDDFTILLKTRNEPNIFGKYEEKTYFEVFSDGDFSGTVQFGTNVKLIYERFAFIGNWPETNKKICDIVNEANYIYNNIEDLIDQSEKDDDVAGDADERNDERKLYAS